MTMKKNPKLYRELSKPFVSREKMTDALAAFWEGLYELRKAHGITDLYVVAGASWEDGEDEQYAAIPMSIGDPTKAEALAAFAYGYEKAQREKFIAGLLAPKHGKD